MATLTLSRGMFKPDEWSSNRNREISRLYPLMYNREPRRRQETYVKIDRLLGEELLKTRRRQRFGQSKQLVKPSQRYATFNNHPPSKKRQLNRERRPNSIKRTKSTMTYMNNQLPQSYYYYYDYGTGQYVYYPYMVNQNPINQTQIIQNSQSAPINFLGQQSTQLPSHSISTVQQPTLLSQQPTHQPLQQQQQQQQQQTQQIGGTTIANLQSLFQSKLPLQGQQQPIRPNLHRNPKPQRHFSTINQQPTIYRNTFGSVPWNDERNKDFNQNYDDWNYDHPTITQPKLSNSYATLKKVIKSNSPFSSSIKDVSPLLDNGVKYASLNKRQKTPKHSSTVINVESFSKLPPKNSLYGKGVIEDGNDDINYVMDSIHRISFQNNNETNKETNFYDRVYSTAYGTLKKMKRPTIFDIFPRNSLKHSKTELNLDQRENGLKCIARQIIRNRSHENDVISSISDSNKNRKKKRRLAYFSIDRNKKNVSGSSFNPSTSTIMEEDLSKLIDSQDNTNNSNENYEQNFNMNNKQNQFDTNFLSNQYTNSSFYSNNTIRQIPINNSVSTPSSPIIAKSEADIKKEKEVIKERIRQSVMKIFDLKDFYECNDMKFIIREIEEMIQEFRINRSRNNSISRGTLPDLGNACRTSNLCSLNSMSLVCCRRVLMSLGVAEPIVTEIIHSLTLIKLMEKKSDSTVRENRLTSAELIQFLMVTQFIDRPPPNP
ncbi:hypothetical protein SNEBB_008009 [Seison nebaliae]|nr:hypothetical protein SNEBB_008009 [Seison nebaliae]